jgi:hypothetical protein
MVTTYFDVQQTYNYFSRRELEKAGRYPFKVPLALGLYARFEGAALKATDHCFLIDRSNSMNGAPGPGWGTTPSRWEAVRHALRGLKDDFGPNHRVSLITFDTEVRHVADGLRPASEWTALVDKLPAQADGWTNMGAALREGARVLSTAPGPIRPRNLMMLTDGIALAGENKQAESERDARAAMQAIVAAGIDYGAMGFGDEYNQIFLMELDVLGNGRGVRYIDRPEDASRAFRELVREQEKTVLSGVRMCCALNVEHFNWNVARMLNPRNKAGRPIRFTRDLGGPGPQCSLFEQPLNNVGDAQHDAYTLILEGQPAEGILPDSYLIGSFWLASHGEKLEGTEREARLVVVADVDEKVPGFRGCPSNPSKPIVIDWRLAQIADHETRHQNLLEAHKQKEAIAELMIIKEILEQAPNSVAQLQQIDERLKLLGHDLSPEQRKKYTRREAENSTVSSPSAGRANADQIFQRAKAKGSGVLKPPAKSGNVKGGSLDASPSPGRSPKRPPR